MIVELAIAGGITYVWNRMNTKEERKIKKRWINIMQSMGIKNKFDQTFEIFNIKETSYGYSMLLNTPDGLSEGLLQEKVNILESNLKGLIELDRGKWDGYIKLRLINHDVDSFKFEPQKAMHWMLYVGKDIKGKPCFINVRKDSQLCISGATGTGKSFLLACMLTNLIYNSSKYVDIYLGQIIKGEISAFENCECVKSTDYTEESVFNSISKICRTIRNRTELFKKYGIRNIEQWNKHFPKQFKKEIFYVAEEMSFFVECEQIWEGILMILKAGRSVGCHFIGVVQRTTVDNFNGSGTPKSQMTRITFRQKSTIDSVNVINIPDAVQLKEREIIIDSNEFGLVRAKTPWIDEDYAVLNKYVPSIRIPTKEIKQEIMNIKKQNNKIIMIEEPKIVDVKPKDIREINETNSKTPDKPQKRQKIEKGVMTLEEYKKRRNGE